MRLVTYLRHGEVRVGAWINGDAQVVDLKSAAEKVDGTALLAFQSMQSLIEAGPRFWQRARTIIGSPPSDAVLATTECTLLAPLPMPVQIRDCLCFPHHLAGVRRAAGEWMVNASLDPEGKRKELKAAGYFDVPEDYYDFPVYYIANRSAVFGPDVDIVWPAYSSYIDYELEWAAVIGKTGRQIPAANAREYIFGYTIFNDWSARDEQFKVTSGTMNLGPGQGKDFANGFGPCIVTADEIPNPYALTMKARVNGMEVSSGNTSSMHYKFEDLIEHLTRANALLPGEVLCSGTVSSGCGLETGQILSTGDVIELEVQSIGRLKNRAIGPHLPVKTDPRIIEEVFSRLLKRKQ